ncbi:hypothetical protein LWI29_032552 [Acer saccharum]|uniref:Uncharacterized protein n=1 Tax=Acer saccharum TaxID=4024 RepID=A0AA39VUI3_ACESA|nr:hypothetical protein LWI29_032552 [Acer saccharum]
MFFVTALRRADSKRPRGGCSRVWRAALHPLFVGRFLGGPSGVKNITSGTAVRRAIFGRTIRWYNGKQELSSREKRQNETEQAHQDSVLEDLAEDFDCQSIKNQQRTLIWIMWNKRR